MLKIIRVYNPDNLGKYSNMSESVISDDRLSLSALGLLAILYGKPDGYCFNIEELVSISNCDKSEIYNHANTLSRLGYVTVEG